MPDCIFPNGSTITFAGGFSARIQQTGGFKRSVATADVTPIAQSPTSFKLMKLSQRQGHEPISFQAFFNPDLGFAALGGSELCTILFPGGTRSLTGLGGFISDDLGELISDEVTIQNLEFQFIGGDVVANAPRLIST